MKQPSNADKIVKVSAYLTDAEFGYDHWRAAQFMAKKPNRPALLLMFDSEAERDAAASRVPSESPALQGTWPKGVHRSFVEGAKWWQAHKNGATMFGSERDEAECEAVKRYGPADAALPLSSESPPAPNRSKKP